LFFCLDTWVLPRLYTSHVSRSHFHGYTFTVPSSGPFGPFVYISSGWVHGARCHFLYAFGLRVAVVLPERCGSPHATWTPLVRLPLRLRWTLVRSHTVRTLDTRRLVLHAPGSFYSFPILPFHTLTHRLTVPFHTPCQALKFVHIYPTPSLHSTDYLIAVIPSHLPVSHEHQRGTFSLQRPPRHHAHFPRYAPDFISSTRTRSFLAHVLDTGHKIYAMIRTPYTPHL